LDNNRRLRPEDELGAAFSDILSKVRGRVGKTLSWGIVGLVVLAWVASGVYVVQASEQGVVRTLGSYTGTASPGFNYHLPWPIQEVDVIDVQNIRRAEIGFRSGARAGSEQAGQRVLEEALMLTRDENIVEVGLLVQYRVKDAAEYVFNVQDPEQVLATSAEVALRSAVGQMPIDSVITERRADVQDNTRTFLTQLLDDYRSGIQVTDVRLQVADAPDQVRDSFHEVVRAREDKERTVNEAQAYREDVLPKARGESKKIVEEATAFREERLRLARGDSERFLAILTEYQLAPDVTRERMYLEAVEKVLGTVDKFVIDGGAGGNVLPFLPLTDAQRAGAQPAAAGGQ
jgi:modulator of FtsH protease HflK